MSASRIKTATVAAVAALGVAAGGTAIAASSGTGTSPTAFLDAVAKRLGISSEKLQEAAKAAAVDQVDAALAAGDITEAQAEEMKERIESGHVPGLGGFGPGGPGPGRHGGGHLDDAATYLGLTEAALMEKLRDGETLGEVAEAQGKTVAGLKAALLAGKKEELAQAVEDGRLTQAQADEALARAGERLDDMIAGTMPERGPGGHGMFGPPPATAGSSAAAA